MIAFNTFNELKELINNLPRKNSPTLFYTKLPDDYYSRRDKSAILQYQIQIIPFEDNNHVLGAFEYKIDSDNSVTHKDITDFVKFMLN